MFIVISIYKTYIYEDGYVYAEIMYTDIVYSMYTHTYRIIQTHTTCMYTPTQTS